MFFFQENANLDSQRENLDDWENPLSSMLGNSTIVSKIDENEENVYNKKQSMSEFDVSGSREADIISIVPSPNHTGNRKRIIVSAPAGPLGLLLESNPDGPRVCEVESDSPLIGLVEEGDVVVSINGTGTQTMDSDAFAKHLATLTHESQYVIQLVGTRPDVMEISDEMMSL